MLVCRTDCTVANDQRCDVGQWRPPWVISVDYAVGISRTAGDAAAGLGNYNPQPVTLLPGHERSVIHDMNYTHDGLTLDCLFLSMSVVWIQSETRQFCLVSTQFLISKYSVVLNIFETEQLQIGNCVETTQNCNFDFSSPLLFTPPTRTRQDKTVLSCLDPVSNFRVFSSPQYIWNWTVANWNCSISDTLTRQNSPKLGRDKARQFYLVHVGSVNMLSHVGMSKLSVWGRSMALVGILPVNSDLHLFWGSGARAAMTPRFELGRDFCTYRLKFQHPVLTRSEVIVLTNKQTDAADLKHSSNGLLISY